ncbi:Gfo/Idh/MocA family oxidoreductase [Clostridium sp.]|uniref:Gfo/Idh/MocA family protein n=1 Tax=Clostridium sp. TaxID=1506 RepID=UPI002907B5C5|nr:Gfo/Idh/MocA family oxidoreductase [Clostridium sp.]MDU5106935.1 Gfo/Idh/MocA family oxidoreductase [Clostridium sp.]
MKTVAIIGAGQRGQYVYAEYIKNHPEEAKIIAVVEPNDFKRNRLVKNHGIKDENIFKSTGDFFSKGKIADLLIIATMDEMHYEQTLQAIELGYDILLEKPISPSKDECLEIVRRADEKGTLLMICHVLRYTPFFRKIKEIIKSGVIGEIVNIQHNENVGIWHMAHSFVRGNWRREEDTSPIILQKSCHDLDILVWLVDDECEKISSFGDLTFFTENNKPKGAADRCINCNVKDCIFDARKAYLPIKGDWPANVVSDIQEEEEMLKSLSENQYGRCVFSCDNTVCDHQVTIIKFKNGVTATFNLSGFTHEISRTIKIMGTKGEIRGNDANSSIEVIKFTSNAVEEIKRDIYKVDVFDGGHNGGDEGLMEDLFNILKTGSKESESSAIKSLQSHLMAFAAEESRLNNKVVKIQDMMGDN